MRGLKQKKKIEICDEYCNKKNYNIPVNKRNVKKLIKIQTIMKRAVEFVSYL